ncbi:sigma factor-like helix-turn-helix DNA-binding protein [Kitasatospora aureofaciens]|uniref:sigma factor-like helix-turn-helix DNA-binding protein n=1 Tax=Kitasatospora aureofaciens TaxID=1894 RepID=UPI003F4D5A4E
MFVFVFVFKEVFDFSYAEIGEAVERSESAVRQVVHRARARAGPPSALLRRPGGQAGRDRALQGRVLTVHNVADPEKPRAVSESTVHDLRG